MFLRKVLQLPYSCLLGPHVANRCSPLVDITWGFDEKLASCCPAGPDTKAKIYTLTSTEKFGQQTTVELDC